MMQEVKATFYAPVAMPDFCPALARDGYALVPDVVPGETIAALLEALESIDAAQAEGNGSRGVYALRNLLDVPAVRALAVSPAMRALVEPVLGAGCFAVRGLLFDKTPGANWKVPWHQDLSIAVRERKEVPGFGPWSEKAGVPHVQPPVPVLENMLTLRLHLDDCPEANGPLRVSPGSHQHGKLDAAAIEAYRHTQMPVTCPLARGGVLAMRPLLLHASSACQSPQHRRVVHLEYAAEPLPNGLEWHARVGQD